MTLILLGTGGNRMQCGCLLVVKKDMGIARI